MGIGFIRRNTIVLRKNEKYKLLQRYTDGIWKIEQLETGRLSEVSEDTLLEELRNGALYISIDDTLSSSRPPDKQVKKNTHWDSLSEGEKELARYRWNYVSKALLSPRSSKYLTPTIAQVAAAIKDDHPPSVSTVKNWVYRFISGGNDISALTSRKHLAGNNKSRMPKVFSDIVDASIDQVYLTTERGTMNDALLHAIPQIQAHNRLLPSNETKLPIPNINYFWRRLNRHSKFDICAARYGQNYAVKKFRNVLGFSRGERPLQRVEIDHTVINMIVIDERSALPLGRPWLTIALDDDTRCVLGYYLSFEPPSYLSVAYCLVHALLPKSYVKKSYPKIVNKWDCYGVFEILVVDNGTEFHCIALEDAALRFGTSLQYCPRAAPWFKGKIERFLGTMNRGVAHGIPGTTFSNVLEKEDYDSESNAVITLSALHEIIHTWIIDFYQHKPHKGIQDTPANRWLERTAGQPIPLPLQAPDLEAAFAVPEDRVLTHQGIEIFNMHYNSDECQLLRARLGANLDVVARYLPQNIGYIYLQETDTQRMIKVPVTEKYREYATGLSKWQHSICRKYALRHLQGNTDIVALAEAKARIAAIVEEQIFHKRRTLRKREARHQNAGTARTPQNATQADIVEATSTSPTPTTAPTSTVEDIPSIDIYPPPSTPTLQYVLRSKE